MTLCINQIINYLPSLLSNGANVATIVGVVWAIKAYLSWKKDYKLQESHEYALDLLKKFKHLHFEIESLRSPKFFNNDLVIENIREDYIPKIQERIFNKAIGIQVDLLISENILVRRDDLQKNFIEKIKKNILDHIGVSIFLFKNVKNQDDLRKSILWQIIFPSEQPEYTVKPSILGIGTEVIDDDFNKKIEENFNNIYEALQKNMILKDSKKIKTAVNPGSDMPNSRAGAPEYN